MTKQEALKFGKTLEKASKNLKPSSSRESIDKLLTVGDVTTKPTSDLLMDANKQSSHALKTKEGSDPSIKKVKLQELEKQPKPQSLTKPKVLRQSQVKSSEVESEMKGDKSEDTKGGKSVSDEDAKRSAALLRQQKSSARANFFSSLTTPPTSPPEEKKTFGSPPGVTTMDYTVRMSPVRTVTSGEVEYKVTNSVSVTAQTKPSASSSSSSSKPTSLPVSSKKTTSETKNSSSSSSSSSSSPSPSTPNYAGGKTSNIPIVSPRSPSNVSSETAITKPSGDSIKSKHSSDPVITKHTRDTVTAKPCKETVISSDSKGVARVSVLHVENVPKEKVSGSGDFTEVKHKRPPPPPPPRKSSKTPGQVGLSAGYSDCPTSDTRHTSPFRDLEASVITGHHVGTNVPMGTLTSTPKASGPLKLTTKFEKDLVTGKYSERRQSKEGDKITQSVQSGVKSASISQSDARDQTIDQSELTDSKRDERESSSESTTSSSSLDSQQGGVVTLHCKPSTSTGQMEGGKPVKKPKPPPPQRRSSLSGNKPTEKQDSKQNGHKNKPRDQS